MEQKIPDKSEKKLLQYLYNRKVERGGYGVRNLESGSLSTFSHDPNIERYVPGVYVKHGDVTTALIVPIVEELYANGLVEFSPNRTSFWLTRKGYEEARKRWWEKLLGFLNKNPGLSIPISVVALVVSFFAAFFKK
jgi:hypothetical protein